MKKSMRPAAGYTASDVPATTSRSACAMAFTAPCTVRSFRGSSYNGMGHAVYSVSDPRADIFKKFVKQLATEKGCEKEYALYEMVEHMAPEVIGEKRRIYKGVNANVDFYSGLVYGMLGLPKALYTPIFAAARIVGWSAHRLEELKNVDKIIRPAYKPLCPHRDYIRIHDR